MAQDTASIKISDYVAFEMSGSAISDPDSGSGYDPLIGREYVRCGGRGTYRLTKAALTDLAEFCDALSISATQGGNPSGGRALTNLAEKALGLAGKLP